MPSAPATPPHGPSAPLGPGGPAADRVPGVARIELLGAPGLYSADGERIALERRTAALLAVLAIEGRRPRAELAALLWPDAAPAQARNSLRQRMFRLQRAAGAEVVVGNEELRLAATLGHDLAGAAERLAGDPHARIGDLLEGLAYDDTIELAEWVNGARERWRRQRSDWLAELASRHEARQQIAAALVYAQRLLDAEPLLEHAHRRVMRLHYLRGDRSAALAAYEHCRRRLRDELGTQPDRETRELAAMIESAHGSTRALDTRPAAPPISVLRPPTLSGRAAERARIAAAIADRRTLLLHGEPGIGKTRLLEDAAEGRPDVLAAGAQAGDTRVPFALLARIAAAAHERVAPPLPDWARAELARLAPAFGEAPRGRVDPLRLQQALEAACYAWAGAGLLGIVVDDLHHADEASLECVLGLAGRAGSRLAWVLGVRTHEMPPPLQSWRAAQHDGAIDELALVQLDDAAIAALLESLSLPSFDAQAWGAPLARHSGGNPLFALETVRALLALGDVAPPPDAPRLPVPAALNALIDKRLARLSEPALKLARVAALAGADFDADVAAHVLETHPLDMVEPWRELEDAQLLHDGRLTHDLIAEAAIHALPEGIARSLQARLAAALESLGRAAARIAPHWAAAQAWSRAGDTFAQAAREARRASRRSDEIGLWERAADGFDRAGQAGKAFDARADGIECAILVRGIEAATSLVDRLDADQRTEPQRMRALTARATVCLMAGQAAAAESAARAALEAATQLGAQWPRFEAARLLAVALAHSSRPDEALRTIEPFREFVMSQGDAEQRHHFWSDYAHALKAAQRASDTAQALRHAMESAQEAGDYAELATMTSNLALVEGNLGRIQQALDHARRARSLSDPLGMAVSPAAGAIELYVASHEAALGRYTESLAGFERAERCFGHNPAAIWTGLTANHKATVLIHLGQFARARQTLQYDSAMTPATAARRTLLNARLDRALAHRSEHSLDDALATIGERGDPMMRMLLRLEASLALPAAEAEAACAAVAGEAKRFEQLAIAMRADVLRIGHAIGAGTLDGADVDAVAARLREVHPNDTYFPLALWTMCRAYDALERPAQAERELKSAFEWVVERALPQVPAPYRDSFLDRNAANRELLAAAGRRLALRVPMAALGG